jgi:hypothetical protein
MACGIGHWNTALNHCLELMVEGRIKGAKTSKGWVFWTCQETQLQPWEEAIGKYEDLKISENDITLILTTQKTLYLSFPRNSPEAQILMQTLQDIPRGTKLSLLKTGKHEKPLLIRALKENSNELTELTNPLETEIKRKSRNFTKTNHNEEDPKNEHKKQAPTTNLDHAGLGLIFGSLLTF